WSGNLHIRRRQRVFPDSTDARAEGRLGRPGPSVTKHTVFSSSEAQTPHCHPGLVTARPPRRSEARSLILVDEGSPGGVNDKAAQYGNGDERLDPPVVPPQG